MAQHGVELVRSPLSTQDAFVTPEHRIPVKAGQRLTFVAAVRHASPGSRATLAWYAGAEGPSSATTEVTVPPSSSDADDCRQVRVDVAFLGAAGIRTDGSVLDSTPSEVPIKRAMLEISSRSWLLADHQKFPGSGFLEIASLHDFTGLISDVAPTPRQLDLPADSRLEVLTP